MVGNIGDRDKKPLRMLSQSLSIYNRVSFVPFVPLRLSKITRSPRRYHYDIV